MRVLITGSCGFIGSHLVEHLRARGDAVSGLDARTVVACSWDFVEALPGVRLWQGDVRELDVVRHAIRESGAELVYHLAAQSHVDRSLEEPTETFSVNATGTAVVAMACIEAAVPLVYCSTDEVYGDLAGTAWEAGGAIEDHTPLAPSSPYSAGKASGEHAVRSLARSLGLRAVITRGCNAWGSRQYPEKLVPILCRHVQSGTPIPIHDGGYQVRQWIAVEDFSEGLAAAADFVLDQIPRGQVATFNLAGPARCNVRDLVRAFYGDRGVPWKDGGARAGQDRCYHLSGERASSTLGLRPTRSILDPGEIRRLLESYVVRDDAQAIA